MNGVVPITGFDLRMGERSWDFADAEHKAIAAYWQGLVADKSSLWNGTVLLCREAAVRDGVLSARFLVTDYASFVAWRDWGRPDASVWSCFGVPLVISADGGLLIGVMGGWTLNAGKAYPPSGSLEPRDVKPDGTIDLLGSMATELHEETGLDLAEATPGEMVAVFDGPRIAVVRRHSFPCRFAELEALFARHSAADSERELDRIEAVWSSSQTDSRMPAYAVEIIRHFLSTTGGLTSPR